MENRYKLYKETIKFQESKIKWMANEEEIKQRLQELQKQLAKKHMFEESVSNIRSLLLQHYSSASPSVQQLVCISRILFFLSGLD